MARSASRPSRPIPTCRAADTAIRLDRRRRGGDFDALLTLLDPDVVVRIDLGALPAGGLREVCGAAPGGRAGGQLPALRPALVSGSAGIVVTADSGQPAMVMAFTFEARSPRSTY